MNCNYVAFEFSRKPYSGMELMVDSIAWGNRKKQNAGERVKCFKCDNFISDRNFHIRYILTLIESA